MGTNYISGTADRLRHCQLSSPVSFINFWWSSNYCWSPHRQDLYLAARPSRRNGLITIWCDVEYLACAEPLRRSGLSVAAETLVLLFDVQELYVCNRFIYLLLNKLLYFVTNLLTYCAGIISVRSWNGWPNVWIVSSCYSMPTNWTSPMNSVVSSKGCEVSMTRYELCSIKQTWSTISSSWGSTELSCGTSYYDNYYFAIFAVTSWQYQLRHYVSRLSHCPVLPSVYSFIRSDIVTTITHERFEQFW